MVKILGLVLALSSLTGCVKTTRIVLDKDGREVERVETIEPSVVTVYGGPVVYRTPVVYEEPVVVYERPYYRPYRPYYERPVHHVRTVYVGGHSHHHRRHCR